MAGLETPDEGQVIQASNLMIHYLPQNPEFEPGRTVLDCVIRENMAHEHAWDLEGDAKSMLNKLGITDCSEQVKVYKKDDVRCLVTVCLAADVFEEFYKKNIAR